MLQILLFGHDFDQVQAASDCVLAETKEAEKVSRQKEALSPETLGHHCFVQNHAMFGDASLSGTNEILCRLCSLKTEVHV